MDLGCKEILGVKFIYGSTTKHVNITTGYVGGMYWGGAAITIPSSFNVKGIYSVQLNQQACGLCSVNIAGVVGNRVDIFVSDTESKTVDISITVFIVAF